MNILVVDDEPIITRSIKKNLKVLCYPCQIKTANSHKTAWEWISRHKFDIILLDIFFKNCNKTGLDLCEQIRKINQNVPIIMITSARSLDLLEKAFNFGIYDYITKPYNVKELAIRVKRWKNFSLPHKNKNKLYYYKKLCYNLKNNQFSYNRKPLKLSKRNKELLSLFIKKPETLLTKIYIIESHWGDHSTLNKKRNLRSSIQYLRNALKMTNCNWIKTIRGEGYIMIKH